MSVYVCLWHVSFYIAVFWASTSQTITLHCIDSYKYLVFISLNTMSNCLCVCVLVCSWVCVSFSCICAQKNTASSFFIRLYMQRKAQLKINSNNRCDIISTQWMFNVLQTSITPVIGYNFKTVLTVHNFNSLGSIPCQATYHSTIHIIHTLETTLTACHWTSHLK